MTVLELMRELAKYDGDREVVLESITASGNDSVEEVMELSDGRLLIV